MFPNWHVINCAMVCWSDGEKFDQNIVPSVIQCEQCLNGGVDCDVQECAACQAAGAVCCRWPACRQVL